MSEIWLDAHRFAELAGLSVRAVQRKARAKEIKFRYRRDTARNGRRLPEFAASSLPPGAQLTLSHQLGTLAPMQQEAITIVPAAESHKQGTLFVTPPPIPQEFFIPLTEEQRDQARRRADVIAPLLEFKSQCNGHKAVAHLGDGRLVRTMDELAKWIATQRGLSRATVWRWYERFQEKGAPGLLDPPRKDTGRSRFFGSPGEWTHPEVAQFALAKYGEGLSIAYITDAIAREWSHFGISGHPPSYDTVSAFLRSVPAPMRDIRRLSEQDHNAKNAPYLITDIASVPVNGLWISDHRIYDVLVQNDCFGENPGLQEIRVWETAIEDMRLRAIVGAVWCLTPSSRSIASALRIAIARFGLPNIFYCDNGKDFRKISGGRASQLTLDEEGRITLDPSATDLLRRLGIEAKHCIVRHPQSKSIESYFSTVSKRFDRVFGAAYAGSKPTLRSDACRVAEKHHSQFLQGKRMSSPLPLASEFVMLCRYWTEEFNATHCHSGQGMNGRTPYEVMDELLPPSQRRMIDIVQIAELFWERQDRVVSNATVQLSNMTYCGADETSARAMYLANGSKVRVAFDPENAGQAVAYELTDGKPLARLQCQQLVARGPESAEAIANMTTWRNRLRRASKESWRLITSGVPTEIEFLRDRAGLPIDGPPQPRPPLPQGSAKVIESGERVYVDDIVEQVIGNER